MTTLKRHEPPGHLDDLTEANKDIWSKDYISYWMQGEIKADPNVVSKGRTPLTQFFDGTVTPFNQEQKPTPVKWNAFPNLIQSAYNEVPLRWQIADSSRVVQDEYLEWSVNRGPKKYTGDIYSVTFTAEGPEYWQFLASSQKAEFLKKMKDLNSDFAADMSDNDFFLTDPVTKTQVYNPANIWNLLTTTGSIAHLIQPNNTLSAEIDIGAQATVIRKDDQGQKITDGNKLIQCSKYGNPGRHSDPKIGATVNSSFMYDINGTSDDQTPELVKIENPEEVFCCQRGDIKAHRGLRIKVEVPKGKKDKHGNQLLVSNIYDTAKNRHIKYGAQFADYITMAINAAGIKGGEAAVPEKCYQPPSQTTASMKPSCAEFDGFAHPGFAGAPGSSRA
ncbi:hypothetical protein BJX61DRAFT_544354 [Aspergillus egyptiacus]|nr:hypothetical protein BJX61DRAFT_544354 [Aspergillus egyptiacus]